MAPTAVGPHVPRQIATLPPRWWPHQWRAVLDTDSPTCRRHGHPYVPVTLQHAHNPIPLSNQPARLQGNGRRTMRDKRITGLVIGGIVAFYAAQFLLGDAIRSLAAHGGLFAIVGVGLLVAGLVVMLRAGNDSCARPGRAPGRSSISSCAVRGVASRATRSSASPPQPASRSRFHSSFSGTPGSWSIGKEMPILYDPHDPKNAEMHSFLALWFLTIMLLASAQYSSSLARSSSGSRCLGEAHRGNHSARRAMRRRGSARRR